MKYLVVMPAFNEGAAIGELIAEVREAMPFADILVVNDGSSDKTGSIADEKGVMVINHPFNLGYGAALQTGFRFASKRKYAFVIIMDADGQHIPSSVKKLIDTMNKQAVDVVIGSRFIEGNYKAGLLKKAGILLFALIAKLYTGIRITDPTSGFQLINRTAFTYLAEGDNYPLDYPDVNIIMALHKRKFRIAETSVQMLENKYGKSMHSGLRPLLYIIKMCLAIIMVLIRGTGK